MFTLPYVLATLLAVGGGVELGQLDVQIRASKQLKKGDSEARVFEVLGPPRERRAHGSGLFSFGTGPAQWIYGTNVDVGAIVDPESAFPNLTPLKVRLFGPDEGDLVITWDDQGAVESVARP